MTKTRDKKQQATRPNKEKQQQQQQQDDTTIMSLRPDNRPFVQDMPPPGGFKKVSFSSDA